MYEINARYRGRCDECNVTIEPGELCMFEPGERFVIHKECLARRQAAEKSPFKPVQEGVTARFNPPKPVEKPAIEEEDFVLEEEPKKKNYISVAYGLRGWYSLLVGADGEPIITSIAAYETKEGAIEDGKIWAQVEGLEFR